MSAAYADDDRPELIQLLRTPQGKALDVGCHLGAFGAALNKRFGCEVWGIEPSPVSAAVASTRISKVIQGSFEKSIDALADNKFGLVAFNDVLEHMVDPEATLEACHTVLSPDAQVLVSVPNFLHFANIRHVLADLDFEYQDSGVRDRTHLRFFTEKSAVRMMEKTGFEVQKCAYIRRAFAPSLKRLILLRAWNRNLYQASQFMQIAILARAR